MFDVVLYGNTCEEDLARENQTFALNCLLGRNVGSEPRRICTLTIDQNSTFSLEIYYKNIYDFYS